MGRREEERIQAGTQSLGGGTEFDGITRITGNGRRILKQEKKSQENMMSKE